jgi:glycosyltransferase involved in cell wall biosynthesis
MGNSHYHHEQYEHLMRDPGLVVLHDFCLAGFHYGYERLGKARPGWLRDEVGHSHPDRAEEFERNEQEWASEPGGLPEALARRGYSVNRRVIERARAVVFHSEWCRRRAGDEWPELAAKIHVVPMGAEPRRVSEEERREARRALALPEKGVVLVSAGILHPVKMNTESLEAFAVIAREWPEARLVFAGRDLGEGEAVAAARRLGIESKVLFLGHCDQAGYDRAIRASDAGICLRRPPTKGETSASLMDVLRHGRPALVCEVGSFAEGPEGATVKVGWLGDQGDRERLVAAMAGLVEEVARSGERGEIALEYVAKRCSWDRVAARYREIIEGMAA